MEPQRLTEKLRESFESLTHTESQGGRLCVCERERESERNFRESLRLRALESSRERLIRENHIII
jgi:hypothetical protein